MKDTSISPYRIGVIADTHNRLLPRVAEIFHDVQEIWHLGDVCEERILEDLREINPRLSVVLGNNDESLNYPLTLDLSRLGQRFHLVHIPPRRHSAEIECDWLLYGHTHKPCHLLRDGIWHFNPGSAGRANKGAPVSVGMLTAGADKKFVGSIILL